MKALDLFCGAGGVSEGLRRAGFEVTGVDIDPQPHYRGGVFVQADAMTFPLEGYDLIWASPPCQAHTCMSNRWRGKGTVADKRVSLIGRVRERLEGAGTPWVIENVPGARKHLRSPVQLTGAPFGLRVHRPRLFEAPWLRVGRSGSPPEGVVGVYGTAPDGRLLWKRKDGSEQRAAKGIQEAREAMGIEWMSWAEIREAIPPSYAEWIGREFLRKNSPPS